ncbi:MAG TPA: AI-2E family transporter [Usitatibacter sp.]|nr:AI-2E family transporter [Usitatibacter sp.]
MIDSRLEQYARVAAIALLALGCFLVVQPFLGAILFAGILCLSTWPFYVGLRTRLGGRSWLAAVLLVMLLVIALALPVALGAQGIVAHSGQVVELFRGFLAQRDSFEMPGWIRGIPVVGAQLDDYVRALLAGSTELTDLVRGLGDPAKAFMVAVGRAVGQGVIQVLIAIFVAYFFYRDGERVRQVVVETVRRIAGDEHGAAIVITAANAIRGVVYGLIGTALAQAAVAFVGFLIAGVPGAFLLAAVTFILSLVPMGPVVIWGGAAAWLYFHGSIGMAIFMVVWGVAVISSVDNFIKPILMSRAGNLSMLLVVLGVFGGAVAFGFIGLFIGPALLAVAWNVLRVWLDMPAQQKPAGAA